MEGVEERIEREREKMFRKDEDVTMGGATLLKNKDMRNLRTDLEKQTKLSKEDVDEIFPAKVRGLE